MLQWRAVNVYVTTITCTPTRSLGSWVHKWMDTMLQPLDEPMLLSGSVPTYAPRLVVGVILPRTRRHCIGSRSGAEELDVQALRVSLDAGRGTFTSPALVRPFRRKVSRATSILVTVPRPSINFNPLGARVWLVPTKNNIENPSQHSKS